MSATDIVILLDRSGSMQDRRSDHEGGLRSFVEEQKNGPGECFLTFIRFDSEDPFEIVVDRKPIQDVDTKSLELIPRGGTPLLHAVGRTFAHVTEKVPKDSHCVVMIITDGQENSSHALKSEFTKERVKKMLAEHEAAGKVVLYLGANVDAFAEATVMGLDCTKAANYGNDTEGIKGMYAVNAGKFGTARAMRASGQSVQADFYNYTDQERSVMSPDAKTESKTENK